MESNSSPKRSSTYSSALCIICGEHQKSENFVKFGPKGIQRIKECATRRHELKDENNRDTIDRILNISEFTEVPAWHRSCYCWFTSRSKIARVEITNSKTGQPSIHAGRPCTLRSSSKTINFELCLFCREDSEQELHSVTTFDMNERIMDAAKYDQVLSISLADGTDLIASEGKYHLTCYTIYITRTSETEVNAKQWGLAIAWLCAELDEAALKGHVLELPEIWARYGQLCTETGEEVRQSFKTRKSSFKDALKKILGGVYEYHFF